MPNGTTRDTIEGRKRAGRSPALSLPRNTQGKELMKTLVARCCLLAFGIVVMAAGIVLITKTNLGTSPISSLGYVLSVSFPQVSYGMFMFGWNIALLLGQVGILRRDFKAAALLQIPLSVLFSLGIDGFGGMFAFIAPGNYGESLGVLALGIVVLAFGVACTVVANVVMNCGEAFVCAITSKTGWNFGRTKVGFDLGCVGIAVVASLLLLGGIEGVREGTFIAAAVTGLIANVFIKAMGGARPPLNAPKKEVAAFSYPRFTR